MMKVGVRKSVRLQNEKRNDGTVNGYDNVDTLKTVSTKEYQSAIARPGYKPSTNCPSQHCP